MDRRKALAERLGECERVCVARTPERHEDANVAVESPQGVSEGVRAWFVHPLRVIDRHQERLGREVTQDHCRRDRDRERVW